MGGLGLEDIAHTELYSRAAEQRRLATDAMYRITRKPRLVTAAGAMVSRFG